MNFITVQFKAHMATGVEVVYEIAIQSKSTNEAARCRALHRAYPIAISRGINVNACFHSFRVS